ncbi:nucleotidyltransferase domain-containing protein [uncultured Fusobacterium sp.]|uniref:type VII toxin-antitoxin system MntA family adenylyltransferase antitoxin n=1 Tax=uncultured Fusobacterium sp. TaxID=159267 RepID=UPI0026008B76|nr:nucleotidyltransferase domain-containing protein [uncultured Fusobacterium sp.]
MDKEVIDVIIKKLKRFNPEFIYIFGSYASGKLRKESDIDIAFFSLNKLSSFDIFLCAQEISLQLKREVDLIDLKNSSTVFQNQVVRTGKVIYEKNRDLRYQFEVLTIKKYIELNSWRKEQLENYNVDDFLKNKND